MPLFVVEMASYTYPPPSCTSPLPLPDSGEGDVGLIWSDSANSVFAEERREFLRTSVRANPRRGGRRWKGPLRVRFDDINH